MPLRATQRQAACSVEKATLKQSHSLGLRSSIGIDMPMKLVRHANTDEDQNTWLCERMSVACSTALQ